GYVDVVQDHYNLLERGAEKELLPYVHEHGMSFVPYFPFASGILAGKYDENTKFEEGDLRLEKPAFQGAAWKENLQQVAILSIIAEERGVETAHLVLARYWSRDEIATVIIGAKRPEQIITNLRSAEVELDESENLVIDALFRD